MTLKTMLSPLDGLAGDHDIDCTIKSGASGVKEKVIVLLDSSVSGINPLESATARMMWEPGWACQVKVVVAMVPTPRLSIEFVARMASSIYQTTWLAAATAVPWFLTVTVMVTVSSMAGSDGDSVISGTVRSGLESASAAVEFQPDAVIPRVKASDSAMHTEITLLIIE